MNQRHPFYLAAVFVFWVSAFCLTPSVLGQSTSATLSGTVVDQNGAVVPGAAITIINTGTGLQWTATTNDHGDFVIPLLPPSSYTVRAQHEGFYAAQIPNIVLNVGDQRALKIELKVGDVKETVVVTGEAPLINESPAVSTVVDRQLVQNLPLNGRSFQSLFTLTPGLVLTKANPVENGQFSVNGQRADANYLTIDGASANIGAMPTFSPGQSVSGAIPGLSAAGGTNNLVSIDALQEFRVETSSFAAEYGRTPGAQVSVITRSGTNAFHGTAFEYFRNDVFDANDWFSNRSGARKQPLRQNDFGGVLGGPIFKNRTFFFFAYEGLRLRQPVFTLNTVPSLLARQNAPAGLQALLNAFPKPNGPDIVNATTGLPTGFAPFNAGYSVPSSFDATSVRLDHVLSRKTTIFGRYNYSPSRTTPRSSVKSVENPVSIKTHTLTIGATTILTQHITNDLRFNYSHNSAAQAFIIDTFGGAAVPSPSDLFPSYPSTSNVELSLTISGAGTLFAGNVVNSIQRQINVVDTLSVSKGSHQIKFGVDYRRLFPVLNPRTYLQSPFFTGIGITAPGVAPPTGSVFSGRPSSVSVLASAGPLFPVFNNFSVFGQDAWRINSRLVLTYGLRWELNPAPKESKGNQPFTVIGIQDPATATLAPQGTKPYATTYGNLAPRLGITYRLFGSPNRTTVLRGGFGIFYDIGNQQAANAYTSGFPFSATKLLSGVTYPLTAAQAVAPSLDPNRLVTSMTVFDPKFKLPRTYQWNVSLEQALGVKQSISFSYVAAVGRDLVRQERFGGTALGGKLNPAVFSSTAFVNLVRNTATSDYHALQIQYKQRLSYGLQGLASYTWSHSIDNESNDSDAANLPASGLNLRTERGNSDFDVRHSFSAGLSYDMPSIKTDRVVGRLVNHWGIDGTVIARTAFPVNITSSVTTSFGPASLRPDIVPGVPLILRDPTAPGGKIFNPAAFVVPSPVRQGTLGRNVLRGFGAQQLNLAVRREFPVGEKLRAQFRVEFFNIFNHPNFGDPLGSFTSFNVSSGQFGHSLSTLAQSLGAGGANGGFNPLYQIGGPRSIQFVLRLNF